MQWGVSSARSSDPVTPDGDAKSGVVPAVGPRPERRSRVQVYADVLRAIHRIQREGDVLCLYAIERTARLTYPRLKTCLEELQESGLISARLEVTNRGYEFLEDVSEKVAPVMVKYGFWRDRA